MKIEYGFCHCGCGQRTRIATSNDKRRGVLRGEPYRFFKTHNGKMAEGHAWIDGDGYVLRKNRTHPRRNYANRVRDHILIAEEVLGKLLPEGAVVHHINGKLDDNRKENLVICESQSYHVEIHRRQRAIADCGKASFRKCKFCHKYDSPDNLTFPKNKDGAFHKSCRNMYESRRRGRIA